MINMSPLFMTLESGNTKIPCRNSDGLDPESGESINTNKRHAPDRFTVQL